MDYEANGCQSPSTGAIKAASISLKTLTWRREGGRAEGSEERSSAVVPMPWGGERRRERLTLVRLPAGMSGAG